MMSRKLPLLIRMHLRLCSTAEANIGWGFVVLGLGLALMGASEIRDPMKYGTWLALGCGSFIGMSGLCFPIHAWFIGGKMIQLIQNGTATQGKFYGIKFTGLLADKRTLTVVFEYQVDEKTYRVSTYASGMSLFTIDTRNAVFYDPTQPERATALPPGIDFEEDELTERFGYDWTYLIFPFLMAYISCGAVIAIAVLVIHAI